MLPTGFDELDFDEYHQETLPRLLALGNGALAHRDDGQVEHLAQVAESRSPE